MNRRDFLEFGGHGVGSAINPAGTSSYLKSQGFHHGDLAQTRSALRDRKHEEVTFSSFGNGYCDFCYTELMGGEYQQLGDGRLRCTRCSRTVIATEEAFRDEFEGVRRNMEVAFGISLATPIVVKMVNAREISRHTGETFTATPNVDPRVLGFVDFSGQVPILCIENGSPRMAAITTMAHELTHVWQKANWDEEAVEKRVGKQNMQSTTEGMAVWAQIQYLLQVREHSFAARQLAYALQRNDEYGVGFRVFAEVYPLREDHLPDADTPFTKPLPL